MKEVLDVDLDDGFSLTEVAEDGVYAGGAVSTS